MGHGRKHGSERKEDGDGSSSSNRTGDPRSAAPAIRDRSIELTGEDALYERHLFFDSVADPAAARPRDRYEAIARSVRDVLSQRWVRTEDTYGA